MRSAAKTNEPLSTASNRGFLSAMSALILSATAFTFFRISSSGMDVLKVLSFIFTMFMKRILKFPQNYEKIAKQQPYITIYSTSRRKSCL